MAAKLGHSHPSHIVTDLLQSLVGMIADGDTHHPQPLPLGRFGTYPRRAAAKFVSGVVLPNDAQSAGDRNVL